MTTRACCIYQETGDYRCEDLEICDCVFLVAGTPMAEGSTCLDYRNQYPPYNYDLCGMQACCFYYEGGTHCDNTGYEQSEWCLHQGGIPGGRGTHCGIVTCEINRQACCHEDGTCTDEFEWDCDWLLNGPGTHCRSTNINCDKSVTIACCLPGGSCDDLSELQCCQQGGEPQGAGSTCENTGHLCGQIEPHGCRETMQDTLPEGLLPWSADICQNAIFEPYIRPPSEYPENDPDFVPGLWELKTVHPVRAMEMSMQELNELREPCAYHMARMTVYEGWARPIYCSQPFHGDETSKQTSIAYPYVQKDADVNNFIEQGATAFVGAYHAPWAMEAQFHSNQILCEGPPI